METAKVAAYLDERGFLRRRLRASLAGHDPGRQDRYDEAWLYQRVRLAVPAGETLSDEDLIEAARLAEFSWPLAWVLARYFAERDGTRVDDLVEWFVRLGEAEQDSSRLARYHAEMQRTARGVGNACSPDTRRRLAAVLTHRFCIELP
jgi:hypothetical protein